MDRRSFLIGSTLAASQLAVPALAASSSYPGPDPTLVVGFAPGGAGDLAARVVAQYAISARDVPVSLDFRPGAGGTIATDQVARSPRDGSILSLFSASPLLVAPHLQAVPYDPTADFTFLGSYAGISIPLFVRSDSPWQSWDDLIDYAETQRRFVDERGIAPHYPCILEPPNPPRDRRRAQACSFAQLKGRQPRVLAQFLDDAPIDLINVSHFHSQQRIF